MTPLHPFLVHFPIALLTLAFCADVIAVVRRTPTAYSVGWWNMFAGTAGLLATVISGLVAKEHAGVLTGLASESLSSHEQFAFASAAGFLFLLFWRSANRTAIPPGLPRVYLLLSAGALSLLWLTAWFGGELVYLFGIGVVVKPAP